MRCQSWIEDVEWLKKDSDYTMTELLPPLIILSAMWFNRLWYSVPLIVTISLVYAATRHEAMKPILEHSLRFGMWVVAFMFVVFVILSMLNLWV